MKFLFASDSFKGTLSSARIAELLTTAAKESFPDCICTSVETADGGEGTTDAVLCAVKGERIPLTVCGPLWKPTDCFYGKLDENRAIMEWQPHPVFHYFQKQKEIRQKQQHMELEK